MASAEAVPMARCIEMKRTRMSTKEEPPPIPKTVATPPPAAPFKVRLPLTSFSCAGARKAGLRESWLSLSHLDTPDGLMRINSYFAQNPQMLLGEMRLQGSMHDAAEPVLTGPAGEIEESIANAARHMAANAFILRGGVAQRERKASPVLTPIQTASAKGPSTSKTGQVHRKLHGAAGDPGRRPENRWQ